MGPHVRVVNLFGIEWGGEGPSSVPSAKATVSKSTQSRPLLAPSFVPAPRRTCGRSVAAWRSGGDQDGVNTSRRPNAFQARCSPKSGSPFSLSTWLTAMPANVLQGAASYSGSSVRETRMVSPSPKYRK